MTKLTPEQIATRNSILQQMVDRADAQETKGKTRDKMCLEFMIGACSALDAVNHELKTNILMVTSMVLATRGAYGEAKRILAETV